MLESWIDHVSGKGVQQSGLASLRLNSVAPGQQWSSASAHRSHFVADQCMWLGGKESSPGGLRLLASSHPKVKAVLKEVLRVFTQ